MGDEPWHWADLRHLHSRGSMFVRPAVQITHPLGRETLLRGAPQAEEWGERSGRPPHVPMTSQRPSRFGWAHHSNQRAELRRNNLAKGCITWSKMECSSRRLTLLPCPRHRRPKLGIPISDVVSSAAIRPRLTMTLCFRHI